MRSAACSRWTVPFEISFGWQWCFPDGIRQESAHAPRVEDGSAIGMRKSSRWIPSWKAVVIGLFLTVIFAEVVGRFVIPAPNSYFQHSNDPELVYQLRPGSYVAQAWIVPLPSSHVVIDSNGCRHIPAGGEGSSVLFLGDSVMFGFGVDDEDAVPAQFARLSGVRAFNCAVPGYGLDQYARNAEIRVPELKPDAIVLGLHAQDLVRSYDFSILSENPLMQLRLALLGVLVAYEFRSGDREWHTPEEIEGYLRRLRAAAGSTPILLLETGSGILHPSFKFHNATGVQGLKILNVSSHMQPDWVLADDTHLTAKGGREIATLLLPQVSELLPHPLVARAE
jgi:hypothetical protein